jgi:hypothetical protein
MRIYRRTEFLKLPPGTVYAKGVPWAFEDLSFKGDTTGNDWWEHSPTWVDAESSEEAFGRLNEMLEGGASYPMANSECRDGCFNDDAIFLVFERTDLEKLRELIDGAINVSVS